MVFRYCLINTLVNLMELSKAYWFFSDQTPIEIASALLKKSTFLPTSISYYNLVVITGINGTFFFKVY